MRIFIDIGHPAHVHYFRHFISIMQARGHTFLISARDKEVSQVLLDNYKIPYINRGKGSANLFGKMIYAFKADQLIYKAAKIFNPDLFLSFASPYAAHVSKLLKVPHIALTDTENARLGILSFAPFTECILTPVSFKKTFGLKHVRFNGYMELCYLHPNLFTPDPNVLSSLGLSEDEPFAILRFVSWGANHDLGQSGLSDKMKLQLVALLEKRMRVFISSEARIPDRLSHLKINIPPEKIHDVLFYSALYIGEGATMASECAMLGTPSIYVNTLEAGTIHEQELKYGLIRSYNSSDNLIDDIDRLLETPEIKKTYRTRLKRLIEDKIEVTPFLVWFIENYPESFKMARKEPSVIDRLFGNPEKIRP